MGSRTWRGSRWCCGSEESGNGARFWVELARRCFGIPVAVRAEEGEEMQKWNGDSVGRRWGLQDAAVRARASTARGLRAQASGDGWRHAASFF